MKKQFSLLVTVILSVNSFCQNTFPSTGNTGINTTTPSEKLQVNGNVRVDSSLVVSDSAVIEKDLRTKGKFTVEDKAYFFQKVTMYDKLNVMGNINGENNISATNNINAGNNLNVTNNVNIANKLDVTGHATFNDVLKFPGVTGLTSPSFDDHSVLIIDGATNKVFRTNIEGLRTTIYATPANPAVACLAFALDNPYWVSGYAKLIPSCPEVNVGVGLLDPLARFHVSGTTFLDGYVGINTEPSGLSKFHIKNTNGLSGLYLENDQSQVNVPQVGWVGLKISTTNPDIKAIQLIGDDGVHDVFRVMGDGTVWATEINVDVKQDFPDYVFAPDYNLICIDSVQHFVETERHLPNMPTAEEVKEGGINVAEFEVKQTEKIEELYLYMFEMNKRLKELEEKVSDLEDENRELKDQLGSQNK